MARPAPTVLTTSVMLDFGTPDQRVFATVPDKVKHKLAGYVAQAQQKYPESEVSLLGPWTGTKNQPIDTIPLRRLATGEEF